MLEQLNMRLKGRSWVLMLLLIAVVALAACGPTPEVVEKEVVVEKPVVETVVVEKEVVVEEEVEVVVVVTATSEPEIEKEVTIEVGKVVVLELATVIETPVPVPVENRQPLQLDVFDTEAGRLHFRLEIETDDYPPGNNFQLEVMAIPREEIARTCQNQEGCEQYPEVVRVEDGRLIILVDSTEYVTANPYAFSVTGIDRFANPVSVSISVDIPPEEISEDHGIIISHEDGYDPLIEHFPARLIQEGNFFRVASSDDPDDPDYYAPIYRCCRAYCRCSSGPACLKCE